MARGFTGSENGKKSQRLFAVIVFSIQGTYHGMCDGVTRRQPFVRTFLPWHMTQIKQTWTRAHDLALIYIALAYGTDEELSEDELATITDVLQEWRDDFPADEVQDVVMEAVAIYLKDDAENEVIRSIDALKAQLSHEDRERALEDVMRIAKADGVVLRTERDLIHRLAVAWEMRDLGERLIDNMTVSVESKPSWSLLHDIGLMYLIMAHCSDNKISETEIAAMIKCLEDWEPELEEEGLRLVLREALSFYAGGITPEELQQSVTSIRKELSITHCLVVLEDLTYIAQADGDVNAREQELLENLGHAWQVKRIRLNGKASS